MQVWPASSKMANPLRYTMEVVEFDILPQNILHEALRTFIEKVEESIIERGKEERERGGGKGKEKGEGVSYNTNTHQL